MVIRKYNSRLNTENGNTQYERETDRADIKNSIQIMTLCTYNVLNEHFLYRSLKD